MKTFTNKFVKSALAMLVVFADVLKGAGGVLIGARISSWSTAPVAAGVAAIIGHVFPVWLRFQGGKGVATACGVFGTLAPAATATAVAAGFRACRRCRASAI